MTDDRKTVIDAYLWWCADEVCDCTQYRIERRTPRPFPNRFFDVELLWEGDFWTDGTGEYGDHSRADNAQRLRAFRHAARAHGIPLHRESLGHWRGAIQVSAAQRMQEAIG